MVGARVNSTTASKEAYTWWTGRFRFLPVYALTHPALPVISPAQAKEIAEKMIGSHLITKQTGSAGRVCNAVGVLLLYNLRSIFFYPPLI